MTEERADYDFDTSDEPRINPSSLLPFTDPGYIQPTATDLRELMRQQVLNDAELGDFVGVASQTVRKWIGGEQAIPYAAWRLLLVEAQLELSDNCTILPGGAGIGVIFEFRRKTYIVTHEALSDHFEAEKLGDIPAFLKGRVAILRATERSSVEDIHGRRLVQSGDIH